MLLKKLQTKKFWIKYILIFIFLFVIIFSFHNYNVLVDGIRFGLDPKLIFTTFFDFSYTFNTFGLITFFTTIILASYIFALSFTSMRLGAFLGSLMGMFGTFCFVCGFFIANLLAVAGIVIANLDTYFGIAGILILIYSAVIISKNVNRGLC